MRRAILDADGAAVLDQHACGVSVRLHDQVRTIARRPQIGGGGAPAAAVVGGRLVVAGAFLLRAIEVRVARDAGLEAGLEQQLADFPLIRLVGDTQRTAAAMEFARAAFVVLGLAEIRQDEVVVPALAAALAPFVVVGVVAAHVDHAVDRAGAAQHLAARLVHDAVVQVGFRLAVEHPVDPRIAESAHIAEGNVDPGIAVLAARLQQQHAVASGLRQPRGKHASRRPGAGDDVVVGLVRC